MDIYECLCSQTIVSHTGFIYEQISMTEKLIARLKINIHQACPEKDETIRQHLCGLACIQSHLKQAMVMTMETQQSAENTTKALARQIKKGEQ